MNFNFSWTQTFAHIATPRVFAALPSRCQSNSPAIPCLCMLPLFASCGFVVDLVIFAVVGEGVLPCGRVERWNAMVILFVFWPCCVRAATGTRAIAWLHHQHHQEPEEAKQEPEQAKEQPNKTTTKQNPRARMQNGSYVKNAAQLLWRVRVWAKALPRAHRRSEGPRPEGRVHERRRDDYILVKSYPPWADAVFCENSKYLGHDVKNCLTEALTYYSSTTQWYMALQGTFLCATKPAPAPRCAADYCKALLYSLQFSFTHAYVTLMMETSSSSKKSCGSPHPSCGAALRLSPFF